LNTSPLKVLFWKECRENLKWSVLALLALSLGLAYAVFRLFYQMPVGQPPFLSLDQFWDSENLVLTISPPLIGLALGLLQILPEQRRDQWAFLIHRPASRTTLFWGKVLPGVCLYLLATVPPLLGLAAWAAQPSHVPAPFDFRFTLAGWAAVLAGLPFYFAGLLTALRPARWYGSRALPVLAALIAPWAASWFSEFWMVALACLFVTFVLLCAAWGSFLTGGEYEQQTKPARFALGLTLYPTLAALGIGAIILLFAAWNALNHPGSQEWWRTDQQIDAQGHIYISSEHSDRQGHITTTVADSARAPVDLHVWENLSQQHKLFSFAYLPRFSSNQQYSRYSDPSSYVFSLSSSGNSTQQTYWYYAMAAHEGIGYTVTGNRVAVAGYLGPQGFGKNRQQAGRFGEDRPEVIGFAGLNLLRFPHALYSYDVFASSPSLHLLQSLPGGSGGFATLSRSRTGYIDSNRDSERDSEPQVLLVSSGDQVTAYTGGSPRAPQTPTKLFTLSTPAFDPKSYSDIEVAVVPDHSRFFFWYGASHLVTVASDGQVIKSEAPPYLTASYTRPKTRFVDAAPALVLPPASLVYAALYGYVGERLNWSSASGLWSSLVEGVGAILFFSAFSGLVSALLAVLISRRCGDERKGQMAWALGVFWLGGYGVLLLLALRGWPVRLSCPHCGRLRVVDRVSCEHCGAAWPAPVPDGTEIRDAGVPELMQR